MSSDAVLSETTEAAAAASSRRSHTHTKKLNEAQVERRRWMWLATRKKSIPYGAGATCSKLSLIKIFISSCRLTLEQFRKFKYCRFSIWLSESTNLCLSEAINTLTVLSSSEVKVKQLF